MKTIILKHRYVVFIFFLFCVSCEKDDIISSLSEPVNNFKYAAHGGHVKFFWDKPDDQFDSYILELSKEEDFSSINHTKTLESSESEYTFWKLNPGEDYFCRIKMVSNVSNSDSQWATLKFNAGENNILLPITEEDVENTTVQIKWNFETVNTENNQPVVTKIVLKPIIGLKKEYELSDQNIEEKSIKIEDLQKGMQYKATIVNGNFIMGERTFKTEAEAVDGVWTLNPYSDLETAIEKSANGDKIMLEPGIYDLSTVTPEISDKSISIEAISSEGTQRPKLYARGFIVSGELSGLNFRGLDISGARIDEYGKELSNSQDHMWNNWLVKVDIESVGFDVLVFDDCIIRNYWAGIFNLNDTNRPPHKVGNLISINNSIVYNLGGDNTSHTLNIGAGQVKKGTFTNSTYYQTNIMFVNIDAERNKDNVIDFEFSNNTVDRSWSAGSFDFKEVKNPSTFLLKNNIFSNMTSSGNFFSNFAYEANDFNKRLINTNFFNVHSKATIYGNNLSNMPVHSWELRHPNTNWNEVIPTFIMNDSQDENPNSIKEYTLNFDPGYENPQDGNFTVSSGSPLRNVNGGQAIGDPRWW